MPLYNKTSYLKEEERRIKALEWDRKEQEFLAEFRDRRKEIDEKWHNAPQLEKPEFSPDAWKPDLLKRKEKPPV